MKIESIDPVDLSHIQEQLRPFAVPVDSLVYDPANARLHGIENIDAIKHSLKAFGQDQPLVVQNEGRIVRKGNGRLRAAKELGWKYIAAIFVDEANITAVARAIADNRTAELATWDNPVLFSLLAELKDSGLDTNVVGFSDEDIAMMKAAGEATAEETQEALDAESDGEMLMRLKVTMDDPKTVVERGQVWKLGIHILCVCDVVIDVVIWQLHLNHPGGVRLFAPHSFC